MLPGSEINPVFEAKLVLAFPGAGIKPGLGAEFFELPISVSSVEATTVIAIVGSGSTPGFVAESAAFEFLLTDATVISPLPVENSDFNTSAVIAVVSVVVSALAG